LDQNIRICARSGGPTVSGYYRARCRFPGDPNNLRPLARRYRNRTISPEDTALSNTNFRRRVWVPALAAAGLEGIHIHDLRHTGNQLTANAGANPRELIARMGHDSPRAALIYMHSSDRRQRTLVDAVAKAARAELNKGKKRKAVRPSGARVARRQA
jgi:integrase